MSDVRLVALAGTPGGALRGVAALREPSPKIVGMERDAKPAADEFGHTAGGPKVGSKTMSGRFLRQPCSNLLVLLGGQKAWPARRWLGRQSGVAFPTMAGHPLGDGNAVNPERTCHGGLRLSTQHRLNSPQTNGF